MYPYLIEAKKRADFAYANMMNTYKKRVKYTALKTEITVPTNTLESSKTVGDYYSFTKILKEGDSNEEVTRLQTVLKRYGYLVGVTPTGYFGPATKSALIQFSREVLKIQNPTGIFDEATRLEILRLVWK